MNKVFFKYLMQKCNFTVILMALICGASVSCGDPDPDPDTGNPPTTTLSVNSSSISLNADGSNNGNDIVVTATNTDWSVSVTKGSDWLKANKNGDRISISADENKDTKDRNGEIVVKATADASKSCTISVTQKGKNASVKVNGVESTSLQFSSNSGVAYKQTVKVSSNVSWSISGVPEWLSVSPTNGNGEDISVEIYPKTNNDQDDNERIAELVILADGTKATINVRQDSDLDKDATVTPTNIVTLYNGIAFDYKFGKNVSYYYRGYMKKTSVALMTDAEIITVLEQNFDRYTQSDNEVAAFAGLDEGVSYMIYTVGYNKDGKRGKLTKTEFTTRSLENNEPEAWISNPTYDNTNWYWTIEKSATCYSYYMITTENWDFAFASDVFQAWMIDYYIRTKQTTEYVNGGNWHGAKYDTMICIMTWGLDKNGKFSNKIRFNYGFASNSSPKKVSTKHKATKEDRNYSKDQKITIFKCRE